MARFRPLVKKGETDTTALGNSHPKTNLLGMIWLQISKLVSLD